MGTPIQAEILDPGEEDTKQRSRVVRPKRKAPARAAKPDHLGRCSNPLCQRTFKDADDIMRVPGTELDVCRACGVTGMDAARTVGLALLGALRRSR